MNKLRIGIFFGGKSKEREVSFAGGRTVYDNLNKQLFEAIPIFVDSFNRFVLLDWQYVYKGSIRDFYPNVSHLPDSPNDFQIYAESLGNLKADEQQSLTEDIGKTISSQELPQIIDFAFLCLHGPYGEDGTIQGLLSFLNIPFSGSGIFSSSIGIDKIVQKKLMEKAGFSVVPYLTIQRKTWFENQFSTQDIAHEIESKIGFPCVVKSATQGSSIGISIIQKNNSEEIKKAILKSFFSAVIQLADWQNWNRAERVEWVRTLCDIREGIGIPVRIEKQVFYHPESLFSFLETRFNSLTREILIESLDTESEILIESFVEGKEFSSIVIENEDGKPVCLPPTEIRKGKELFDYRSKYLPGLSRKITPIDLAQTEIEKIRKTCEKLYSELGFGVYARIDGFYSSKGEIFLNDPNTTSGMMPSSFFFHQAAEIGCNPSQFITYIIFTSLLVRTREFKNNGRCEKLADQLNTLIKQAKEAKKDKKSIAVILGGYSSERHISVESGRNVYEKLSSSAVYEPIPIFLTGNNETFQMYRIPINLMLKDNADDIAEKIRNYHVHPIIHQIIDECADLTGKFGQTSNIASPELFSIAQLAEKVDEVFIALHGRPGEDGALQVKLEAVGLPYNGSGAESSSITIDKFRTNELLKAHGILVAEHFLVSKADWQSNQQKIIEKAEGLGLPFIAKPVDDGCSSAVKKIHNTEELKAFADLMFRNQESLNEQSANTLHIKLNEEFPIKQQFLLESLITSNGAANFLEVTGGMLTHFNENGEIEYEIFEASEALSGGDVLSLEEKFLAGQGQNITPARYAKNTEARQKVSNQVKLILEKTARILNVRGYCRIDAFVRVFNPDHVEVIIIEVNSLPGMTPATCIFHQTAINGYKPYDFIEKIMTFAEVNSQVNLNEHSA
jgi:D-alanine-D-alanine ligase